MPPLRKKQHEKEKGEMVEVNMQTLNSPDSSSDSHDETENHPVYGAYRSESPRYSNYSRPGTADYYDDRYSSSTLQADTPTMTHSGLEPPPPFARQGRSYAQSYTDSQPQTRTSSPYPLPTTPFRSSDTLGALLPNTSEQTFFKKDWVKTGQIAQLHSRDDKEFLTGWKRRVYYLAPFLAMLTLCLYWLYFGLRITFVVDAQQKFGAPFPLAWVFITIEIIVSVPIFMNTFQSLFILKRRHRPKLRLVGNDVPMVDVLVTSCGEDDDLIMDTVRACCDLDYPLDRFRVILLDDAKSENLKKLCEDLGELYHNCYYRSRPKFPGVPHHFKSGNLNYGLAEGHTFPGGASEYVAALDADMIPEQHWLRAIMPHLILDQKMGLACPPQLFYNTPPGDPLCQSLDFFVHVSEPLKDVLGVAWCTGSGYIARREALDSIGQFPLGSLAEDVATSTLMLGRGWRTAFVHEALQFGTVPEDYGSHLKQRTRWAIGTVDTSIKLKFCLWGSKIKQMTFAQRFSSFVYAFLSIFNIFLTISLFAMPVVLIMNKPLVAYSNNSQLRWLIRSCFAAIASNRFCEFVLYLPSSYSTGQRGNRYQIWMAPYIALTIIRSFVLPTWLGGQTQAFKPTGSIQSALNERDPQRRAPIYRRLWTTIVNYLAFFHIAYVYFVLAAVCLSSYRCIKAEIGTREQIQCLLTHAFWPPLSWIIVISSFWVPITYACDPPSMPDREALLVRDPKTGVAHPTKESKKIAKTPQSHWFEFEYSFTTLYTTAVFVASFFY